MKVTKSNSLSTKKALTAVKEVSKKTASGKPIKKKSKKFTLDITKFQENIRIRAYGKFLERGAVHGDDLNDWLFAEKHMKQQCDVS